MTLSSKLGLAAGDPNPSAQQLLEHAEETIARLREKGMRAEVEIERLEMEISEKAAWLERDCRESDKVLCHVASLRRALEVRS